MRGRREEWSDRHRERERKEGGTDGGREGGTDGGREGEERGMEGGREREERRGREELIKVEIVTIITSK